MLHNIRMLAVAAGMFFLPLLLAGQDFRYAPEARNIPVKNAYYCLDFNTGHKQPDWVYYTLTQTNISGTTPRSSTFKDCRQGGIASASQKDYKGSGYDKGHLCPAADMKQSKEAMSATFQMWNMSPQEPSFNRGRWAELEALARSYIKDRTDTLFIVTGPVYVGNMESIGDGVTVPALFYKIVYNPKKGGIGFLLPNHKVNSPLKSWQVSIDLIEALTGIDFFPQLPQPFQDRIEAQVDWWE